MTVSAYISSSTEPVYDEPVRYIHEWSDAVATETYRTKSATEQASATSNTEHRHQTYVGCNIDPSNRVIDLFNQQFDLTDAT